ncbi:MAG: hypothetical protein J6X55_06730 [Victivallales bacterium]|nr:hypothetical protein [Victivallales bacterium]
MNRIQLIIATSVAILTMLLASCTTTTARPHYTSAYTPREGQEVWFTEDDMNDMARRIASCISASEMITDYQRAKKVYAEYMRITFETISKKGADEDAGIRALNLIKRLHKNAEGSARLWEEALTLAKNTDDATLPGMPIPAFYK